MAEENQVPSEAGKTAKDALERAEKGERYDFSIQDNTETKEKIVSREDQIVREEIRRELELMDQDENLKKESQSKAKKIQVLGEEEKIEHLLQIAKEKGVAYAVKMAKDMKDPYILDIFHDVLVREGLWKKFKE